MSGGYATVALMENPSSSLESLSSRDLLSATRALVRKSHGVEADLLVHLGEIDERRLYAECPRPSMFAFCVEELGFSDDAAYNRITVARAGRKLPAVIEAARSGRVHLAGLRRLAPHLTQENHQAVLAEAAGKSKRDIELLVARLAPLPPVPATIRKLPDSPVVSSSWLLRSQSPIAPAQTAEGPPAPISVTPRSLPWSAYEPPREPLWQLGSESPKPAESPHPPNGDRAPVPDSRRPSVTPLTEETFKVQFTASRSLRDKLQEAQDLLRHRLPNGDMAAIFEQGLDLLIAQVKKERFGVGRKVRATPAKAEISAPENGATEGVAPAASRHIPDAVKRFVYERDEGRCTFVDDQGRRCTATAFLEFDHEEGFARTHQHDPEKIRLLCRAHNQHAADCLYGRAFMDRARAGTDQTQLVPGPAESATASESSLPDVPELVPGPVDPAGPMESSQASVEASEPEFVPEIPGRVALAAVVEPGLCRPEPVELVPERVEVATPVEKVETG